VGNAPDESVPGPGDPTAPVVAFCRTAESSGGPWTMATDQQFKSSRLTFTVPRPDSGVAPVAVRITRNAGELIPGIHLAEVRVSGASTESLWSWLSVLGASLLACLLVAAAGLAFGALFSRATALLACLCVLVIGTLAPVLHLGDKPQLLRELESGSSTHDGTAEDPGTGPFGWMPHLALPASRERLLAGETVTLHAATEEVRNTGWIAVAFVLSGWALLFWRDWEDATADT
jgi:uncharacterized membrane protein YecN with MAPEG domain